MKKTLLLFLATVAIAITASAKVTTISPDAENDALRLAVHYAEDGDIIEMTEGTYVQCNNSFVAFDGKSVTIKAAEGANVVLQLQVPITIANGGKATLQGIKIDASRLTELASWYEHVIYPTDATEGKELVMDGCELYGFNINKSAIYSSSSNTLALCDVKNCYFHDNMKSCFFFEGASIAELSVVNSTFANIATDATGYYAGIIDVRNAAAKVTVDHCTFYNCLLMNTDYAAVTMKGPQAANVVISNNIFMLPEAIDGHRAIRESVEATNCMTFNYVKDNGGIHSSVTKTNCQLNVDPKFVDAANGNFALAEGSPALTAGTDGKAIGDPRWVSTEGGDDNTGDDNEDPEDQPEEGGVNIYVSTSGNDDNDGKTPETAKATLEKAYEVTNAGGTIVLAGGTYTTSDTITIDKAGITIKAEEDANVVLQPKAPIEIGNGGKLALQNIKIDASQLGSNKHVIEVIDATDEKELVMDGCELYGYSVVHAAIYVAEANTLKVCEVDNCYFHDNMKSCIFLEGAVSKFLLLNSTFANIATSTSSGYLSVVDVRNTTSFIANHCTFYNCQAINTDHAAIKVEGDALIANSVFVSPASQSSYRAVHAKDGWNVEAKNCLTFNYGASKNGIRSAATQTDCVVGDPLFVDAANGNFAFAAGSPALASGTNGTNMGDLRWNPSDVNDGIVTDTPVDDNPDDEEEEEEEEIIPNGKKLYLSTEGNNNNDGLTPATAKATFAKAVAAALDGDTIIVADGLYSEAYEIKFEKLGVVVMAAEGAKPVVQLTGQWTSIVLMATTTFDGITFDGAGIAYYLLSSKGTDAGTFTFKNCEFTNWDSYWAISNQYSDNTHVKSVVVDNCIFHNATGAAIHFNENGPRGAHACDNLTITNSTFYNLSVVEWVGIIQLDGNTGAKQPNNLILDHITMYNYKTSELGGIVSDEKTNLTLTNSIIANPANVTQRYGYAYGTSTIDHNLLFNVTKDSGTHTNEIAGDPMFVFPDGGNFNLRPGSPALNAAADGKHLGDNRWGEAELVAVSGVQLNPDSIHTFTTDTTKIEVVILPVEATNRNVTWKVADPTIVKLENGSLIALKAGKTLVTVTTEDGNFTATAPVVVEQKKFHPLVIAADSLYVAEDYTVPSYVQMLVAKENARRDSTAANVAALQAKIDALQPHQAPYDVVVNINGDPRTNMAFAWFTNETMTEGKVQLVAKADATEADFADAIEVEAVTESTGELPYIVDDSGIEWKAKLPKDIAHTYISHKALATGLTPNTTYTYRVGVDGYWSEMGTFLTAPERTNEFSFIYMSDSHIESQAYIDDANAAARAALKVAPDAKFCAFPGDFVENYCSSEWEWERLFEEALRPMTYKMPIVPTDGNHDVTYGTNFQYHFNTDKTFHDDAEEAIGEELDATTYSFMYGDVLFLVFSLQDYWKADKSYDNLTSVYLTNHVGTWFKEQVAAHPEAKLRVGLVHYNIFSGSSHQDDEMGPLLRATLLPVIKECEIDFVIQGHDHCYEVMGPVDPDTRKPILEDIADREVVSTSVSESGYKGGTYTVDRGAMYFIGSTCGHKRYWPYTKEEMEEDFSAHQVENYFDLFTGMFAQPDKPSFSVFTVSERTITVESYTANPDGSSELFNTFKVQRTKAHTGESNPPTSLEQLHDALQNSTTTKVLHNGQVLIIRNGEVYTIFGQQVK